MQISKKKRTAWKKNRKFGDIFGGRMWPKRKDGIIRRAHSLSAPSEFDETPIFIADNTSRDYYFPVTPDDIRAALKEYPYEDVEYITHIWLRKHQEDDVQGYLATGSGVVAIVLYPMRKDLKIDLGNRRPSGKTLRWYEGYGQITKSGDRWYVQFTEETAAKYFIERLLAHEIGHCVNYTKGLLNHRSKEKEEKSADNYAYEHSEK